MTREEFLHWAIQFKDTQHIRKVVSYRKFTDEELDVLRKQMEPHLVLRGMEKTIAKQMGA